MPKKKRVMVADPGEPDGYPDPEFKIRTGATGTPILLADGREWLLADGGLDNDLDEIRDRVFESVVYGNPPDLDDHYAAAAMLLQTNYVLTDEDFLLLIAGVPPQVIVDGVCEALFGPLEQPRGYTAWVRTSLKANGLKPEDFRASEIYLVMETLAATGRAIPQDQFVKSIQVRDQMDAFRALARKG